MPRLIVGLRCTVCCALQARLRPESLTVREEGDAGAVPCFIQVTVPANALVSKITDRMPAILQPEDWPVWLGEVDAPLKDVKALLRTFDDAGNWEMTEQASSKAAKATKTKPQMDLF